MNFKNKEFLDLAMLLICKIHIIKNYQKIDF